MRWPWRGEELGHSARDDICGTGDTGGNGHQPSGLNPETRRWCWASLGKYREQSVSLHGQPLVREDKARRIHVGTSSESSRISPSAK